MPSHFSRRAMLAAIAATPAALVLPNARADASTESPDRRRMATIGIASGQRAVVSLFHHPMPDGSIIPCVFEARLVGLDGSTLASGRGTVDPGRGSSLELDISSALKRGERIQAHCNVDVPEGHEAHIGATLEVYDDQSGETAIAIIPCIRPQPAESVEMGLVSVAHGQIARLSLFRHDDGRAASAAAPFRVDIIGMDGRLFRSDEGRLPPGRGVTYDYDLAGRFIRRHRVPIHAMVRVPAGSDISAALELFDARTGHTLCWIQPCIREDSALAV